MTNNIHNRKNPACWFAVPVAVFALGVLSVGLLVWTNCINNRQRDNIVITGIIKDLKTKTATAHLWIEESMKTTGQTDSAIARANLAEAVALAELLVAGGETPYGRIPRYSQDSEKWEKAQRLKTLLTDFRAMADQRFVQANATGVRPDLDEHFNDVFQEIEDAAGALDAIKEEKLWRDHAGMARLYRGILLTWALLVIGATAGLLNREAKRKQAEEALATTLDGLEIKVDQRTSELRATNQQLAAELVVRMKTEEELRTLSEQFHTLLNAIPDSITLLSPELQIEWANQGAVLAGNGGPVADRYCYELWHGATRPCEGCPALRTFRTGGMENLQVMGVNGRIWDLRSFPVRGENGGIVNALHIARDITEQTARRKETERTAHLAALGELAAGVAHEINNPVNGIINCGEILVNKTGEDSREHDLGQRIVREGSRIAFIVKSLLAFSREEAEDKVPALVREILEDTLALVQAQMRKEGIDLKVEVDEGLEVQAQPRRLQQVFLNLINNARDALNQKYPEKDEGKALAITARLVETDEGPKARIAFRDQGTGISPSVMNRIMDPFFSTKPQGKGTGLGLSISHGIVENHGGRLTVASVPGEFTEVTVELPLLEDRTRAGLGNDG